MRSVKAAARHLAIASTLLARQPWQWQAEQAAVLAGLTRGLAAPPGLEDHVAGLRAQALLDVRRTSARLLCEATAKAQRHAKGQRSDAGDGRFYRPVTEGEVLAQVPVELQWLLCLGPKRRLRAALLDATTLTPGIWKRKGGWAALGMR